MKLRMPQRLAEHDSAKCTNCREVITEPSTVPDLCTRCVLQTNGELHICGDCGREWTELGDAHCTACHRHFSSDSAFDAHQRIDHRPCKDHPHSRCYARSVCQDPAALYKRDGSPRLFLVETERGVTWSEPEMPAEVIARLRSRT